MKYAKNSSSILIDERYYELKLRMQILIVTIILAGSAITFIGWNTQENIIKTVREDILNEVTNDVGRIKKTVVLEEKKINSFDSTISDQKRTVNSLASGAKVLKTNYNQLDLLLKNKIRNLKTLLSIYIVTGIKLSIESKPIKLFFKDMKPINADRLPLFKLKPIINIQTDNGLGVEVDEITTDYIILSPSRGIIAEDAPVLGNITIWFLEET